MEEQHRKRVVSSLPSQPPIHHPFHHTDSHIPHFHYLRRMVLLGIPRLIADCRDSLFHPPQSHPKCSTITLVCILNVRKIVIWLGMTNHMNRDSHDMSHTGEALYWTLRTYSLHHFKPFWAFHFTHPSAPPFTSHPISHSLFPFWPCCDAFEDVDWW